MASNVEDGMQTAFQVGDSPPVLLTVRDEVSLSPWAAHAALPIAGVEAVTIEALREPLGFPPLTQAVVEGDHVAIALEEGVRGGAEVVRGIVNLLREVNIPPAQVSVVVGSKAEAGRLQDGLEAMMAEGLQIIVHDPADKEGVVFVAADDEKPLRLNRFLGEADFVIPVACARHELGFDVRGPFATLFPRFSDAETIAEYHSNYAPRKAGSQMRREKAERVGWLLGVTLVVETLPAPGGGVAAVIAGEPRQAARASATLCEQIWQVPVLRRADLVIASLGGGAQEQTWENVARALHAAARVSEESQSAIVICTELDREPGPLLRRAADAQGCEQARQALVRARGDEAAQARELCQALDRGPVYFMGRLPESTIEDLGMAPLANFDELTRLISRSGSCLVINDGQHAVPILSD